MDFTSYIEPELYITVPVLYVLGMLLKKSVINDKWIPVILGIMGVALVTVYKLTLYTPTDIRSIASFVFAGITQGILCASASVYANNLLKQMLEKSENTDKKDT